MSAIVAEATLGELVSARPGRARVFEALGLDYCCGGRQTLATACDQRGLAVAEVVARLDAEAVPAPDDRDWREASLGELLDHLEATHHEYLKRELPRLAPLVAKVLTVHGDDYPWLAEVAEVFGGLREEIEAHLHKEERILFPYIRRLEGPQRPFAPFGTVRNPIGMMEHEHDNAGAALARLRALTGGYQPPEGACATFQAVLAGLAELEFDLHTHIHKENNILHPRAIAAEQG